MAKPYYFPLEATLRLVFPASDHQLWSQRSVLCAHTHAASAESGRAELGSLDSGPALSTFTAELPVTKHFISEDSARARTFSKQ